MGKPVNQKSREEFDPLVQGADEIRVHGVNGVINRKRTAPQ